MSCHKPTLRIDTMNSNVLLIPAVLLLLAVSWSSPVKSEYYKYYDRNGNLSFTDNLGDVPPGQREKATRYREINSPKIETRPEIKAPENNKKQLDQQIEAVKQLKKDLDGQYETLAKKRDNLQALKDRPKTKQEDLAYRQQVEAFNREINEYEQRRIEYDSRVKEVNSAIDKVNEGKANRN